MDRSSEEEEYPSGPAPPSEDPAGKVDSERTPGTAEKRKSSRRLSEMLESLQDEDDDLMASEMEGPEEDASLGPMRAAKEGNCVECDEDLAILFCEQCTDHFCQLCFEMQHRKGSRVQHSVQPILRGNPEAPQETSEMLPVHSPEEDEEDQETFPSKSKSKSDNICSAVGNIFRSPVALLSRPAHQPLALEGQSGSQGPGLQGVAPMSDRAKFIPLRLTYEQRKRLRTLEAALKVSRYTDRLDIAASKGKSKRLKLQLQEVCGVLSGLVVATDYKVGQEVIRESEFPKYEMFFQDLFELGRRYKIMNPEKMRGDYGKLLYLMQDAVSPQVRELLGLNVKREIRTVYALLRANDGLSLLEDPRIELATRVIAPEGKTRAQIQREIAAKEDARKQLVRSYTTRKLTAETIEQCLYSLADNNYYLYYDRDPIDKMIGSLKKYFSPSSIEEGFSLAIVEGMDGARLSHNHERQYNFVLQSLLLWREVINDMFRLWYLTDEDILAEDNAYILTDTGQGLHRVQQAPRVSRAMHVILHDVQRKVGNWIGSSVIHLGDRNVPNALMFIDKYAQVAKIIGPIVKTLEGLSRICESNKGVAYYIETEFKDPETAKKTILADFFREAFDGSGADNFFDAGSCVDGRLTSAWNWCSHLPSKKFFPIFKLVGFIGFDGKFT